MGIRPIFLSTKGGVGIGSPVSFIGLIDCSANPNYPASEKGNFYIVSVAGKIGGASGVTVEAGDGIYCTTTNGGGTQAAVGAFFSISQANTDGVVIGPASATNNAVAIFDTTTGKIIKNSGVTLTGASFDGISAASLVITPGNSTLAGLVAVGSSPAVVANTELRITHNGSNVGAATGVLIDGYGFGAGYGITMTPTNNTSGLAHMRFNNAAGAQRASIDYNGTYDKVIWNGGIAATIGTIDNTIIGGTTKAAGSFTTVNATAATPVTLTNGQVVSIALTSQTVGGITLTIPNFAGVADEFTFKTKSQTLSNKTLSSPVISGGTIDNAVIGGTTPAAATVTALNVTGLTASSPVVTDGSKNLVSVPLTDGQFVIGATAGSPIAGTIAAGTGNKVVLGTNSITSNVVGRGLTFVVLDTSTVTQEIAPNTGYVASSTSRVEFTVPSAPAVGDAFSIVGQNSGGWKISAPFNGALIVGDEVAYSTGNYIESTRYSDSIGFMCVYADVSTSIWFVDGAPQGIITINGQSGLTSINAVNNSLSDQTGTGNFVGSISPALTTPDLGTPSAITLTNATGLPVSTGISGLGTDVATFLATPSSANLAAAVTGETGTGALVFATSPTFVTPTLGAASATSLAVTTGNTTLTGLVAIGSSPSIVSNIELRVIHNGVGGGSGTSASSALAIGGYGSSAGYGVHMTPINDTNGLVHVRFNNAAGSQKGTIYYDSTVARPMWDGGLAAIGGTINSLTIGGTTPCQIQGFSPTNYQTGTTYTLVLGDSGKWVDLSNASAITCTIPPNASVAFAAENEITLYQSGAGQVTPTAGAGVTLLFYNSTTKIAGQYAAAVLKQTSTLNTWRVVGNTA